MATHRDVHLPTDPDTEDEAGRKVIAVIGIDRYRHWQRLESAVNDATRAAAVFQQLGFAPIATLLDDDATGAAIESLVTTDLRKLGTRDSLVVFYAGHGSTQEHRPGGKAVRTGYLVPVDGAGSADDTSTWVGLDTWLRAISLLPARHILVILDACHSGIALGRSVMGHRGTGTAGLEPLAALQARRSRVIIASTLDDQLALDGGPRPGHSLFAGYLLEGLERELWTGSGPVITGSELAIYAQRCVRDDTNSRQTPTLGRFELDEGGEIAIAPSPGRFEDARRALSPTPRATAARQRPAAIPHHAAPITRGSVGRPYIGSVAFVSIPDLKLMDGRTSHAAMTALHRVLRETFLADPERGIRVLSALVGAIIVVPDTAAIDVLDLLTRAAKQLANAGVALRIGLTRGALAMQVDTDGIETAIAPVVNVAARLANAKRNDGLLVDRSYQQHFSDCFQPDHYLHRTRCNKHLRSIKGKRDEAFKVFAAPKGSVHVLDQSTITRSEDLPPVNAMMLAYDLASFSAGDASVLAARFRTVVQGVREVMRLVPDTTLFSPGGDGAVLVLTDPDLRHTFPEVEQLALRLAAESRNMSPQAEVTARLGLHYGVIFRYVSAEGVERPTGPDLFDVDEIANDTKAREHTGSVIISRTLLEAVAEHTAASFEEIDPLVRGGRTIHRSVHRIQGVARQSAAPSLRVATEAIIGATRRRDLRFLDDALQLTSFESRELRFEVVVERPYLTTDEAPGTFTGEIFQAVQRSWLAGYDQAARNHVTRALRAFAKSGNQNDHDCKIALTTFDTARAARGTDTPPIGIRPVNNLVCQGFNIAVGSSRVEPKTRREVEVQWAQWLDKLLLHQGAFRMPCPSQLFLELILITADGAIPRPLKASSTSVYAKRNDNERVYTCGLEDGSRWSNVVVQNGASRAVVDFNDALLHGLEREYRILAAATDSRGHVVGKKSIQDNKRLLACRRPPRAGLFNLVVQGLHLNSAVLGYCVLPITQDQLADHLKATESAGGLDFTSLAFIKLEDCASVVADFERDVKVGKPATEWHGTAIMRLQLAAKHRALIDEAIAEIRAA